MRINEIASAEEQMGLWKLVSDNMWQAISTQAEQEKLEKAKKAAAAKAKPAKRGGGRKSAAKSAGPLVIPTVTNATPPQAKALEPAKAKEPNGSEITQAQASSANSQKPSSLASQQNAADLTQQLSTVAGSKPTDAKLAQSAYKPLTPQQMRMQRPSVGQPEDEIEPNQQ